MDEFVEQLITASVDESIKHDAFEEKINKKTVVRPDTFIFDDWNIPNTR